MKVNVSYYVELVDVTSGDKVFNIDTKNDGEASSIMSLSIVDSIFEMYPYGSFLLNDSSGRFFSDVILSEGHKYRVTLGYIDKSLGYDKTLFLTNQFYWSNSEIVISEKTSTISGTTLHSFSHYLHLKDGIFIDSDALTKSKRYFKNKSSSDVAKELVTPYFLKNNKYVLISKSKTIRDWYLSNYSSLEFIENVLTPYSLSLKDDSPFFAFFNLKDEFHFRSAVDLLNNNPIPPNDLYTNEPYSELGYFLNFSEANYMSDRSSILEYKFIYIGTDEYQRLINMKNYFIDIKTGKMNKFQTNLANQIYTTSGKLPIKSPNFIKDKREDNIKDIKYIGLHKDENLNKAKTFSQYVNSVFLLRLQIVVYFDPNLVSGRTIFVTFYDSDKNVNSVLTGRWLILKAEHKYELKEKLGNRTILSYLDIGKNSFRYEQDGGYYYNSSLKPKQSLIQ